jgi:hypothetical protein
VNVDDRREALEAISVSAEASVQERLRALEMLRELPPSAMDFEVRPDSAEELADDPERVIELADEYLFPDLPAYRERVERRALEIVEERAAERRTEFAVVRAYVAQDDEPEEESTAIRVDADVQRAGDSLASD